MRAAAMAAAAAASARRAGSRARPPPRRRAGRSLARLSPSKAAMAAADHGANGGAGAASSLANAVSGSTVVGRLTLSQTAYGGVGGASYGGVAGLGGNASAMLAFNDLLAN